MLKPTLLFLLLAIAVAPLGAEDGAAIPSDTARRAGPSVDKRPFVADLSYGLGLIAGRWQLTFTQVYRTREFETQPHKDNEFGSVTLSFAF